MRYFEDGDLTEGLQPASKPCSVDCIDGEWHIVWADIEGSHQLIDYDDVGALPDMCVTIKAIPPSYINVELRCHHWHLTYKGHYNINGPATKLTLTSNHTPKLVNVEKSAYLVIGMVRDDENNPFISLGIEAQLLPANENRYQNMGYVGRKTDQTGVKPLEISRNECLCLGFEMDTDGAFKDFPPPVKRFDQLTQDLNRNTEERESIKNQLRLCKQQMDSEYDKLGL